MAGKPLRLFEVRLAPRIDFPAIVERHDADAEETDDDGNAANPAPFPSMAVIYNGERVKE